MGGDFGGIECRAGKSTDAIARPGHYPGPRARPSVDPTRLAEDGTLDRIATVDEVEGAGARAKELR